jgi:adenosine deaminase CECR1
MPKGGLLHVHLDATVNAATLLKLALEQPAIHIRVKNVIDAHNILTTLPEFGALPSDQFNEEPSLSDQSYVPNTWIAIQRAREGFSPSLGGPSAFDRWVLDAMMINPSEAYGSHNTVKKVLRSP